MKIEKKTEFKIDDIFEFGFDQLRCIKSEDGYCYGCIFEGCDSCDNLRPFIGPCSDDARKDGLDVIFVKI